MPLVEQKIGLLGCGNIARIITAHSEDWLEISACHDIDSERQEDYARRTGAVACASQEELLAANFSLLLEAASVDAARACLIPALEAGKDVVVLSVGSLADRDFLARVRARATELGRRVHVPSGAIFGLDNIKVARLTGLARLQLKTSKHPRALGLETAEGPRCVFRGPASEAVKRFPKNVNVSAALGLAAGSEPDVELWADPELSANRHEIRAAGPFGEVTIRCDNLPSPDNPATSYLAALSVLSLLANLSDPIQVGS